MFWYRSRATSEEDEGAIPGSCITTGDWMVRINYVLLLQLLLLLLLLLLL